MQKEGLNHCMLIFYTLKYIPQKEKVKVLRDLNGYKEKKHGKEYHHSGLVQKAYAEKLGSNVILVPIGSFADFQNFFSKNNIGIRIREVWTK